MTSRRAARIAASVVVSASLTVAGAACGSTDSGVRPGAARTLHGGVQIVRAAASVGDREAAASALAHLERSLADLRADGRVDAGAEARIRRAIATVRADLALIPTTTPTTTTTTTTRPEHGKDHDEPKGPKEHKGPKGDD